MDRGERERYHRLTVQAKQVLGTLIDYAKRGVTTVNINTLRHLYPDSRSLLATLKELEQRAYGHLHGSTDVDPVFTINAAQLQSL